MKMGFVTVYTDKMDETVEFYTKVLNFEIQRSFSPRPGMTITFLSDKSGSVLEFIMDSETPKYEGRGLSIGFHVDDMNQTLEHLKKHNVEIVFGPIDMPNGVKLLHAKDLNGLELGFVQEK